MHQACRDLAKALPSAFRTSQALAAHKSGTRPKPE